MKSASTITACLFLLAMCAFAQERTPSQPVSLAVGSAIVADFKGNLSILSPRGESLSPKKGLELDPETDLTVVKGSILLNLHDGSQALLKSNTHVVLKSPDVGIGMYLELLLGKLVAKIQKRMGEAPPFRIGTPSAVITVRGTRFQVEVTKNKRTYVEVFEGIVEIRGLTAGGQPVLLRPGFATQVETGRDPAPPRNRVLEMRDLNERTGGPFGGENEGSGREIDGAGQERQDKSGERESGDRPD